MVTDAAMGGQQGIASHLRSHLTEPVPAGAAHFMHRGCSNTCIKIDLTMPSRVSSYIVALQSGGRVFVMAAIHGCAHAER
jgi:hypothetical protein